MNYFDSDISNNTNSVLYFDGKGNHLYLRLRARSRTIYTVQVGCSIFQPAKFEQMITHQHVLSRWESFIDGIAVTVVSCLHVLIAHRMCISIWICWLFSGNIDV